MHALMGLLTFLSKTSNKLSCAKTVMGRQSNSNTMKIQRKRIIPPVHDMTMFLTDSNNT
jgi:hypothetical protein